MDQPPPQPGARLRQPTGADDCRKRTGRFAALRATNSARSRAPLGSIYPPQLSVVVPVYNEAGNIRPLVEEIEQSLAGRIRHEIVVVDDGSVDGSADELQDALGEFPRLKVHTHTANRGQSAAILTGVRAAAASIVAVLDGDGQNDPRDLPTLFGTLSCCDAARMVVGERRRRQDSPLKRLSSRIANAVRSRLLGDGIRDTGCGLKVFYRDDFLRLPAFDHMHRFLPALVQQQGGRVIATPVNHRPRLHGTSKYGIGNRLWVGLTDLLGVLWLSRRRL